MKHKSSILLIAWLICMGAHLSAAQMQTALETGGDVTVITSDRLTFDYEQQYAYFEGHVVVTDPEMKLTSEEMTVLFNEESEVTSIEAVGDVRIQQDDKIANSGRAVYEVATGKIMLQEKPRVRRGKDLLQGDTITFWRDQNKMVCEPRARLVIFPEQGNTRDKLFGE
jgi:lipopolysaccharide export system protein LptA